MENHAAAGFGAVLQEIAHLVIFVAQEVHGHTVLAKADDTLLILVPDGLFIRQAGEQSCVVRIQGE